MSAHIQLQHSVWPLSGTETIFPKTVFLYAPIIGSDVQFPKKCKIYTLNMLFRPSFIYRCLQIGLCGAFNTDFLLSYCFVTTNTDWWHAAMLYHISATASTGNLSFRNFGFLNHSLIHSSFFQLQICFPLCQYLRLALMRCSCMLKY